MSDNNKKIKNKTLDKMVNNPVASKQVIPDGVKYNLKELFAEWIFNNFKRREIIATA